MTSLAPASELQNEFAKRRRRQYLLALPMIAAIFGVRWLVDRSSESFFGIPSNVAVIAFLLFVAAAVAFSLFNWRCPSCGKYLGKAVNPSFCGSCGFKLQPDKASPDPPRPAV